MNANQQPLVIPYQLYQMLLNMDDEGSYGISYDIFTRVTQDDLPFGWYARRGNFEFHHIVDYLCRLTLSYSIHICRVGSHLDRCEVSTTPRV